MKLWKVEAKQCDYDQYDTLIVWAETETQAISVAIKFTTDFRGRSNFTDGATASEVIAPEVACVELGSFNAG